MVESEIAFPHTRGNDTVCNPASQLSHQYKHHCSQSNQRCIKLLLMQTEHLLINQKYFIDPQGEIGLIKFNASQ